LSATGNKIFTGPYLGPDFTVVGKWHYCHRTWPWTASTKNVGGVVTLTVLGQDRIKCRLQFEIFIEFCNFSTSPVAQGQCRLYV